MESTPYWKRVWVTVTGRCKDVTAFAAFGALDLTKDYLIQGLTMYRPFTEESYKSSLDRIDDFSKNPDFKPFIRRLSLTLNLETPIAWAIFTNYLMFECYKKIESIEHVLEYQSSQLEFLINLWQFYTLERTYLIRTVHHILENHQNSKHQYHAEYNKFVQSVTLKEIQESLFEELHQLIAEINYETTNPSIDLTNLIERNNNEQLQILLSILTSISYKKLGMEEFMRVFKLMKEHNFTHSPLHMEVAKRSRPNILKSIKNAEVTIFISGLSLLWRNYGLWLPHVGEINEMLHEISTSGDVSTLYLAWVTLQTTLPESMITEVYYKQLQEVLDVVIEKNVLSKLQDIASDPIFEVHCFTSVTMRSSFITVIEQLTLKFGGETVCEIPGVIELVCELLKSSDVLRAWTNKDNEGLKQLYSGVLLLFPAYFAPLSLFAIAIINSEEEAPNIVEQLCHLNVFTERCIEQNVAVTNTCTPIVAPYHPFNNDLVVFPAETNGIVFDRPDGNYTRLFGECSYFRILLHEMNCLFDHIEHHIPDKKREDTVILGYEVLREIMLVDYNLIRHNPDVNELLRLARCILATVTKPATKNFKLMKFFFKLLITQFRHSPEDVLEYLRIMKFLPDLSKANFTGEDFFKTELLTRSSVVLYIQEELSEDHTCDLLLLYIKLVRSAMNMNMFHYEIQIPGFMFLIVKVFPTIVHQFYTDNSQDRDVSIRLLKIVHLILLKGRDLSSPVDVLIFDCFIELFLNQSWHIKSLINIIEIGNTKLELYLSTEMNWAAGPAIKIVKTIKRALSCILFVLHFIMSHSKIENHRFLEGYLYLNCDVSNLKYIAGYINHTFDSEIPKIACAILTKFAMVSNKPILQSLELDDYQVQRMFVDRLYDPLVDDKFRVSIIEFICACIKDQTSMMVAFFNTSPVAGSDDTSIVIFMRDFLKTMQEDPNSLANPLQAGILSLFHVLWKLNKQHIIRDLIEEENFWNAMISPMFKTAGVKIENLLVIIEILIVHICVSDGKTNENFSKALAKLFDESNKFLIIWMNRLIAVTQRATESSTDEVPLARIFVSLWKKFVITIRHFYPEYYETVWNKPMLEYRCLESLSLCTKENETVLMTLWAELCLVFSTTNIIRSDTEEKDMFNCILGIISNFSQFYEVVDRHCQVRMLTVASAAIKNCENYISNNPVRATTLLVSFKRIFDLEYKKMLASWDIADQQKEEVYYGWVLILRVLNTFIRLGLATICEGFFKENDYLERIADVLELFIKNSLPVRVAEIMATSLIDYAESPLVKHFDKIYYNIANRLIMGNKYYFMGNKLLAGGSFPQDLRDWWTIFSYIIRLSGILLHKRNGYLIKDVLSFVISHHPVLIDAMISATMVAESANLTLTLDILRFIYDLLKYMPLWTLQHGSSFVNVMESIKEVLNAAIGVILRPKILVFVPVDRQSPIAYTEIPEENLIEISNHFIEIITWACLCYSRYNPPFVNLLDIIKPGGFHCLIEHDFRVPPVVIENPRILTYGSLLCALHFICKTLGQMSGQQRERASKPAKSYTIPETESASGSNQWELANLPKFSAFIYPSYRKETAETISALHRFTIPETMGLHSWLDRLDADKLFSALASLNTFLAGQAFLTIHDTKVERGVMRYIRRELCSELLFFYDFVNLRITQKNSVVSPISPKVSDGRIMATPQRKSRTSSRVPSISRLSLDQSESYLLNVDVSKICCDRASGRYTTITDVDDCYLLVLVHWFRHVCRLVHYSKFDEFLSQWHAKSTCIMPDGMYVKNTNVPLSDDEDIQ